MQFWKHAALAMSFGIVGNTAVGAPSAETDAKIIAALDTQYQLAVKDNNAEIMDRILHDDFALVVGNGKSYTKADLLKDARTQRFKYEKQDEIEGTQFVRVWGDTAVVTALLWIKGTSDAGPMDRKLWFSDTYIRTLQGWRYVFGQASLALPTP
jgi:ketosteroid isomerase-like protein